MAQIGAFGDPGRDPRSWCVTVAYAALVPSGLDIEAAVSSAAISELFACVTLCEGAICHYTVQHTFEHGYWTRILRTHGMLHAPGKSSCAAALRKEAHSVPAQQDICREA